MPLNKKELIDSFQINLSPQQLAFLGLFWYCTQPFQPTLPHLWSKLPTVNCRLRASNGAFQNT